MTAPNQRAAFNYTPQPLKTVTTLTAAYAAGLLDNNSVIITKSGTGGITLPLCSVVNVGFSFTYINNSSGNVTISCSGTDKLQVGDTTYVVVPYACITLLVTSANVPGVWQVLNVSTAGFSSNSVAIGPGSTTNFANAGSVAIGNNAVIATNTGTGGVAIGLGVTAQGYGIAIGNAATSSGGLSNVAMGRSANASQPSCTAIGSTNNSYIAAAATGQEAIALGAGTASGQAAISIGSGAGNASGFGSLAIGQGSTASGTVSMAIGYASAAGAVAAVALCYSKSSYIGKYTFSGTYFAVVGDAQLGATVLRAATTGATPTVLTSDGAAASAANQVILPNATAVTFTGTVVARQQTAGGTASAAWKIEGLIRRETGVANTVLVASTVTAISNVPGWTLALSADTTNGGLSLTFTGAAATNIRTVATVDTTEVNYA